MVQDVDKIYVSTNQKFSQKFQEFFNNRENKKQVEIFIEPSFCEEDKLGSIGALNLLIKTEEIDEETLVIGGDNLFEFKMVDLIKHLEHKGANIIVLDKVDTIEEAKMFGVAEVDEHHKVISFEEKPEHPKSTLVATACYILTKRGIEEVSKYIGQGGEPDKLGHFIQWLCKNDKVYAFTFHGKWFDIGSTELYHEADEYFKKKFG